ncbi:zinc finger protein klf1 [Teratosphaeria destructans]|uniref:Zinc finger protein klf1 n=1 Tax=Teratosphaeria destructans TaxID=418781 RepID=A0A9W7SZT1_9PEZI|nr:zinc finger protein klf1 [Teratosphaeria destructans]
MFDGQPDLSFATWSPTNSNAAPWLLANDFDVFAVDETLNTAISEWAQLPMQPPVGPSIHNAPLTPQTASASALESSENVSMNAIPTPPSKKRSARALDAVAKTWYTQLRSDEVSRSTSRAVSEAPREQFGVDEQYRDKLTRKMKSRPVGDSLPSVNFLNVCLKAYVSRFHPIFPVIHIPTFRPTSQNAFLLLSMCSIGSLFVGSESVRSQGIEIFWRLNKVILATWDKHLAQGKAEALSMVQAALLGQTFAMLSGKPEDLFQADMFHGTMLAWARKVHIFKQVHPPVPTPAMDEGARQDLWHQWLRFEQCNRFALALSIHDSELASLYHHEPLSRESIVSRGRPLANDSLFSASDVSTCLQALQEQAAAFDASYMSLTSWMAKEPGSRNNITDCIADSAFTAYGVLSSLNASIIEARHSLTLSDSKIELLSKGLISWYQVCEQNGIFNKPDNFNMQVLWHAAFIVLHVDIGALEAAIGRDGHRAAEGSAMEVRKWLSSSSAVRCLLHGLLLQEQVESMRFGSEPALHVPRALYTAALVWLVCSQFSVPGQVRMPNMAALPFAEIQLVKGASQQRLREFGVSPGSDLAALSTGITYGLIDLLQRAGRWGIAESLANTLTAALEAHVD